MIDAVAMGPALPGCALGFVEVCTGEGNAGPAPDPAAVTFPLLML